MILAALLLLCTPVLAVDIGDALDADKASASLPAGAAEALDGLSVADVDPDTGLGRIWTYIQERSRAVLAEALRPVAAVTAVAVICAAAEPLSLAGKFNYVSFGGCLAVAAAAVADVQGVIRMGGETVGALCEYSKALLPTLSMAAVSAGAVTSAGAKYAAAALFSDILLTAAQDLILPLICAYVATVTAGAALGTNQLGGAARLLQWAAKTLLKALVVVFTGYLSLTGILAGSADAAAVKAAKAVLSTTLPVVGGTLASASESLVAGAALVRNAIGAFGLLAVLAAVALPVLRLALRCLLYRAAAAVASVIAGGRIGGLIDAIGSACGLILGLVGAAAAIYFLAIVSLLRTVTG